MIINYSNDVLNVSIKITGELIFNPPTFYADLQSFEREVSMKDDLRRKIIQFIENDSIGKIGTKIIFD